MDKKYLWKSDAFGFTILMMKSKKFLSQGKLLPILFIINFSNSFAQVPNDTLLFLGNKNIAPVIYLEDSIPSGVAVDIVHALAKHIIQPINIEAIDWLEAQAFVFEGKADALIQINQTEEREKIYDFSDPLLESQFSIFVRTNKFGVSGISSLRGLRVGVEAGGLPRQLLEKNPSIPLTIIPNFLEGFKLLDQGTIDAVVVDYRVGAYILAEYNIRGIKVSGEPIAFSYSSIAVKKGNEKLLNAINDAMKIIKSDGTYQKIIDQWKPKETVFFTQEQITQIINNVTILALLIFFLIVSIWIVTLKKQLSKRKAVEERAKTQYSTLYSIIDSANASIFSVDKQYCYTSFNKEHAAVMKTIHGAEIKNGHNLLEYITETEDKEIARRNIDRALAGEQVVEESYSGQDSRTRKHFQVAYSPIKKEIEEIIGVVVFANDITERKRIEMERRQSEEKFSAAFHASPDLICITRLNDGTILEANEGYEQLLGYTRTESVGKKTSELSIWVNPADRITFITTLEKFGEIKNFETTLRRKDGSTVAVIDSARKFDLLGEKCVLSVVHDISERKQAEESLYRLNRELRAISNCNQILVRAEDEYTLLNEICRIICDEAGYCLSWVGYVEHDSAKTIQPVAWGGLDSGYVEKVKLSWSDDSERGQGPGGISIRTGETVYVQDFTIDPRMTPWRESALQRGYHSAIALPLKDEHANVFGVLLIYSTGVNAFTPDELRLLEELAGDLAFGIVVLRTREARKRAEQKEIQLAAIVESSDDAIIGKNLDGIIISWNKGAEKIYGYTESEVIGRHISILLSHGREDEFLQILEKIKSGEHIAHYETLRRKKDGRNIHIALTVSPIRDTDGRIVAASTIGRDITARKEAEEALRIASLYTRSLIEASLDPLVTISPDGKITDVNQATEVITGIPRENLINSDFSNYFTDPEKARAGYQQVLVEGHVRDYPLTIQNISGKTIDVLYNATIYKNEAGQVQGVFAAARDITKQRELERELIQSQKLESIGTLASGIAHDFNNILGIILGNSTILQMIKEDPQKLSQSIEAITKATQRGASLVKQLLTFARKTESLFETVSINEMIKEINKLLLETIHKTIVISTSLQPDLPSIVADASQMHQVLLNLCVNARDAMPNGGTLSISSSTIESDAIKKQFEKITAREYVKIEVVDTGIGMDETTRLRIFEPFFTTKGVGKGTGLGLSTVFGIVRRHNGFIDVRSVPGKGTSFIIYLPILEHAPKDLPTDKNGTQKIPGGTETILFIEDEELLRELVKTILVSKGYNVITAEDGIQGVEMYKIHQKEIAIILSDLGLPKLEGQEVFRIIREINPKVKVIVASGFIEPDMKSEMYKSGLKNFIQKPYSFNEVLEKIREAIDTKE